MMRALVTGGAGFVGSNVAHSLLTEDVEVVVLDSLAREGAQRNAAWLGATHGQGVRFVNADIRDAEAVNAAARGVDAIYHFAAQVAVTTSVDDPRTDFEINAQGTLNALEAARLHADQPLFFYTSTNKVYGGMEDVKVVKQDDRYAYADLPHGVDESCPLDFHSPYGCSKGAADQYVRDYARIYGLRSVVFRMSCIYGPRQWGTEDQGWVAHFLRRAARGEGITIYGDGCQVRDILYVEDLACALRLARERIDQTAGQVYNIGGGPENTISLLELLEFMRTDLGYAPAVEFGDWRPGDQRIYVSDPRRAERDFGWKPTVDRWSGIRRLAKWIAEADETAPAGVSG